MPKATNCHIKMLMTEFSAHHQLRSFGRSYTKKLGLLQRNPYHEELSLLQSRILFEVHARDEMIADELVRLLQVDKGYLSRSIHQLVKADVIKKRKNPEDQRESFLRLTKKGKQLFHEIDRVSHERSIQFLGSMKPEVRREFAGNLASAELLMGEEPLRKEEIKLRTLVPGDLGWVISRHGEVYAQEFGWNMDFERLVGEIAVAFAAKHDPSRERAWIAHARGVRLGCVFLVKDSKDTAKLRILLVDPLARGLGLGTRLVRECIRFARKAKYKKLTLWTNDILHSARKIYVNEGFHLVREEPHQSFGHDLVGQFWELDFGDE